METDLRIDTEPDDGDQRPLITGRRLTRWIVVLAVGIVVVLAVWQEPLEALV